MEETQLGKTSKITKMFQVSESVIKKSVEEFVDTQEKAIERGRRMEFEENRGYLKPNEPNNKTGLSFP